MANITRNIVIDEELAARADKEADRLGQSFSAFVRLLINEYFNEVSFARKLNGVEDGKEIK